MVEHAATKLSQSSEEVAKSALASYDYFTNILRLWFGAYSIGTPALIVNSDKLRAIVLASPDGKGLLTCFAAAIALQVFLTFLNKYTQYGVYNLYGNPPTRKWWTLGSEKISEWIVIDLLIDVATIAFLSIGTISLYRILVG